MDGRAGPPPGTDLRTRNGAGRGPAGAQEAGHWNDGELNRLLDQLPVGVFRARVSSGGRVDVVFASRRAVELVGAARDPHDDLWQWFVSAFPVDVVADLVDAFRTSLETGDALRWQARTHPPLPRWIRLSANFSRPEGSETVLDGILEDVTAAVDLQERVTDELSERTRHAEELAHVDASRTSLLAAVVHDLRTPLATITTSAALLLGDPALRESERSELVVDVAAAARTLARLLDNLLAVGRLRAGATIAHLEPTDLSDVLECGPDLDWSSVTVDLPEDLPRLNADPGLLERVLCNLLHNAVGHTAPGTRVRVYAELEGDRVLIHVVDHGAGIPPDWFPEMFTPYERFSATSPSGLGLGLPIALGFTEAMGGRLTPSVTPGGGLTMTVELEASHDTPAHR